MLSMVAAYLIIYVYGCMAIPLRADAGCRWGCLPRRALALADTAASGTRCSPTNGKRRPSESDKSLSAVRHLSTESPPVVPSLARRSSKLSTPCPDPTRWRSPSRCSQYCRAHLKWASKIRVSSLKFRLASCMQLLLLNTWVH